MSNQNFNDLSGFTAESFQKLQKTNQEVLEKVTRELISLSTDNAAVASKYLQTITRTTSPEDFMNTNLKFTSQLFEKMAEFTQNVSQIYQDNLKDHVDLAKEHVNTAIKATSSANKDRKAG